MKYCRKLEFTQKPDYKQLRGLFEHIMKVMDIYEEEPIFDWVLHK
jgi:hypothetical protein